MFALGSSCAGPFMRSLEGRVMNIRLATVYCDGAAMAYRDATEKVVYEAAGK